MKTRSAGRKRRMLVLRNGSGDAGRADFEPVVDSGLMSDRETTADVIEFARACGQHRPVQLVLNPVFANDRRRAEGEPAVHRLERPFVLIGRAADCDVRLSHPEVSYRHAYLQIVDGRALCVDLASRTGTRWKTGPQAYGWIEPGEDVGIGPFQLSYRGEGADEAGLPKEGGPPTAADESAIAASLPAVALQFLNGRDPSDKPRLWPLRRSVTLVGASPACNVQLRHESVSKVHSSFVLTPAGLWVIDLLGRHGTRVNGSAVRCARLGEGDELQIGRFRMVVRLGASADQGAASDHALAVVPQPASKNGLARAGVRETAGRVSSVPESRAASLSPPPANGDGHPPERLYSEAFILRLMDQFAAMQQQAMVQSQQQMMMLVQLFSSIHESQQEVIREELARVHEINRRLQELQSQLVRQQAPQQLTPRAAPAAVASSEGRLPEMPTTPPGAADAAELLANLVSSLPTELSVAAPEHAAPEDSATSQPGEMVAPDEGILHETPEATAESNRVPDEAPDSEEHSSDVIPLADASADGENEDEADETDDGSAGLRHPDADAHAWLAEQIHQLEREREGRWRKVLRMVSAGRL